MTLRWRSERRHATLQLRVPAATIRAATSGASGWDVAVPVLAAMMPLARRAWVTGEAAIAGSALRFVS